MQSAIFDDEIFTTFTDRPAVVASPTPSPPPIGSAVPIAGWGGMGGMAWAVAPSVAAHPATEALSAGVTGARGGARGPVLAGAVNSSAKDGGVSE